VAFAFAGTQGESWLSGMLLGHFGSCLKSCPCVTTGSLAKRHITFWEAAFGERTASGEAS